MMRKPCLALCLLLVVLVPIVLLGGGSADAGGGPVSLLTTIPIPGSPLVVFDISWVDAATQMYYLADRSNAAIDVIDARTDTFVRQIHGGFHGFTGSNDTAGPNGVVASGNWLFVTDAPSRVVTIDLRTDQIVSTVSTGGAAGLRADELAYDPVDGVLLVVNNADTPPFATIIQVNPQTGQLTVGSRLTGTGATNGIEQPVWNPGTGRFYVSVPEVNGNGGGGPNGAVAVVNPNGTVETAFPVPNCQPAGLTVGPDFDPLLGAHQDLLLGCSVVFDTSGAPWSAAGTRTAAPTHVLMDARTGEIDAVIAGVGGSDEVWYNPGDGRYYTASRNNPTGPVLGVIDAQTQSLVQIVPTFNTPLSAPAPRGTSHSVAANPHNNHVYVPLPANNVFPNCLNGCVAVYGPPAAE